MLIFNCSKAFAEFIEPKLKAGTPPLVAAPPSANLADDAELILDNGGERPGGERPAHLQQWLVHMVRVQRKPCVLAMEVKTRFAMLFTGLKKGDGVGFINLLVERLANEMAFAAEDVGMAVDVDVMVANFAARHGAFRFYLRTDRSTQSHLNDVAWHLQIQADEAGCLPEGHEECAMFDEFANEILRTTKGRKDYFVPAEEMLCDWLSSYGGLTPDGVARVRAQIRAQKRRFAQDRLAEMMAGLPDTTTGQ